MKKTIDTLGKPLIIAIEGVNGSGKSTLARKLHGWLLENVTNPVIKSRQVGGTALGEKLRDCMHLTGNDPLAKVLIAAASMRQQVAELPNDAILLTDRWIASPFAYQCYGDRLDFDSISDVFDCSGAEYADYEICLKLSLENSIERSRYTLDPDYLSRVISVFDSVGNDKKVICIDANTLSADEVFNQSVAFLSEKLGIEPVVSKPLKIGDRVVVVQADNFKSTKVGDFGRIFKGNNEQYPISVGLDNDYDYLLTPGGEWVDGNRYLKVAKV